MTRNVHRLMILALVAGAVAACDRGATGPSGASVDLTGAFNTIPIGFNYAVSSFDASPTGGPGDGWSHGHGDHFGGGLMGGGLSPEFMGLGFGMAMGHGHFGDDHLAGNCSYNATSGRVECAAQTFNGLTITRSAAYLDAAGKPQSAFDSLTTNTINTRVGVSGTFTRRDSAVSTVQSNSDRTVSGLAAGSTQRTINGTAAARETTVGKDTVGSFTAVRVVGDTTRGVVVPITAGSNDDHGGMGGGMGGRMGGGSGSFPTAGTIIRAMQVSLTYAGKAAQTSTRREVITYDGSSTAKLVITQDGTTRNCTISLPRGRPVCQ